MTGFDPALRQLLSDPSWLPHRYDERRDAFHLLQVDRAGRAGIPFLTDEHLQGRAPRVVDRAQAVAAAPAAAPVHFIFHSAYCCSTLLARLLDMPGVASTLKEPVFLNDMVGWRHRGGEGRRIAMVLDQGLGLLARPFDTGEAVIIKPSNVVNALIPAMMAMKPDAKALLLYAPLEQYLSSIARKGMWSRLWVRELLVKQLRDGMVQLGLDDTALLQLTDLQAAAAGWLAQQQQFAGLLRTLGSVRVRSLDSEHLMADISGHLDVLVRHFGVDANQDAIATALAGPALGTDSKTGNAFTNDQRAQQKRESLNLHGEEVAMVLRWAAEIAARFDIPMALDHPITA